MLRILSAGLVCLAVAAGVSYISAPAPAVKAPASASISNQPLSPRTEAGPQRDGAVSALIPPQDSIEPGLPQDLARSLTTADAGADRRLVLSKIARQWAVRSPHQAFEWAAARTEDSEALMSDVCLAWAEINPLQAIAMADSKLTTSRPNTLMNVIANWATKDLPGASRWVLSQPRDHVRNELVQQLAIKQAEVQPRQAAQLVLEEIPAGETQCEAIISVLHQWALRDAASAKAWIDLFPAGTTKDRALRELTNLTAHR